MSLFKQITDTIVRAVSASASEPTQPEREMPMPFLTGEARDEYDRKVEQEWSERREMEERQRRQRQQLIDPYAIMHGQQIGSTLGAEALQRKHEAEREEFERRVADMRKGGMP